jgi:hypothetical protein
VPAALAELLGGGTVASLTVRPAADSLPLGGTLPLLAEALDDTGSSIFANVQWTSLDPDVATVGAHGVVRGVGLGTARIVAQADAQADTAVLVVAPPAMLTIAVSSAAPAGPSPAKNPQSCRCLPSAWTPAARRACNCDRFRWK